VFNGHTFVLRISEFHSLADSVQVLVTLPKVYNGGTALPPFASGARDGWSEDS